MGVKEELNKKKEHAKRITLIDEVYRAGAIPNLVTGIVTILYIIVTARIKGNQIFPCLFTGALVCLAMQFIIAPVTNKFITQAASDDLDSFYNYGSNSKERTKLMKQMMALPEKIGIQVFVVFMIGVIIWVFICSKLFRIDTDAVFMFMCSGCFGAYAGLVLGIERTQKVCSVHTCKIVEQGVLKEEVEDKHTFGTSSTKITIIHIFGPLLMVFIFFMIIVWRIHINPIPFSQMIPRLAVVTVFNIAFYFIFTLMIYKRMMNSITEIRQIMESMDRSNLEKVKYNPTDLSNEFMYNIYLINTIINTLQEILNLSQQISSDVIASSNELSVVSKETAATSLEQTTGIKELLSAMEESDRLAKSISEKIGEVSDLAKVTTEDIDKGFSILQDSMGKLEEIKQANEITDEGILSLSEKITGISDIASIISNIADQTNIIAFNAELEASSAGEAGENFHLVANEIRRLTNNTIQSTNEIQKKIVEIQHSSQELLSSSRNGRMAINSGNKMVEKLNDSFEKLKETSGIAATSSEDIKKIVHEQTSSFEQIVVTLNQIHTAAESFSVSTQEISDSAENLCKISEQLKELQPAAESSEKEVKEEN